MKVLDVNSATCTRALAVALAIGLLPACSPDDGAVATPATATPASPSHRTSPPSAPANAAEDERNVCGLLSAEEIASAFQGTIQVAVNSGNERLCDYGVVGHEGQMLLQPMDAKTYEGRKTIYSQGGYGDVAPVAVPGLGQDAYLMGDSQIEVRIDDQRAFNLGLQLFTVGELPFTREQSRAAMVELARTVAGRL